MTYPPRQGPYGPPPKNRAPLLATLVFVVALLAGVGVLGFVEPGFFLSDDGGGSSASGDTKDSKESTGAFPGAGAPAGDDSEAAAPPSPKESGGGSGDGEAFAQEFVTALNELDAATANAMYCPDAVGGMVDHVIKKGPELVIDTTEYDDHFLKVTLDGTLGGEPLRSGKISVKLDGPCVYTFTAA